MGVTKVINTVTKSDLYRVFQGRTGFGFDIYIEILSSGWYLSGKAQAFRVNIRTKISGKLASLQLGSDYYKLPVEGTQVPNEEWFLPNIMALKISWTEVTSLKTEVLWYYVCQFEIVCKKGCVQQCMRVIESFNKFVLDGGNPDQFNPQPENESADLKTEVNHEEKPEENSEATGKPEENQHPEDESKKNEAEKNSQDAEKLEEENFFKMFEKENLPDISAANMTCLSPEEVKEYQNKMKDCKYLIGTGSKYRFPSKNRVSDDS